MVREVWFSSSVNEFSKVKGAEKEEAVIRVAEKECHIHMKEEC